MTGIGKTLSVIVGITLTVLIFEELGCGESGDEEEETALPGSCGFPPSGQDVDIAFDPGQPTMLDEKTGDAQNTVELEADGQIAPGIIGSLRIGHCGSAGLLLSVWEGEDVQLAFSDPVEAEAPLEVVDAAAGVHGGGAVLFFDADCEPLVIRPSGTDGFVEHFRDGGGAWIGDVVLEDLSTVVGEQPSYVGLVGSDVGRDGRLHVFAEVGMEVGDVLVLGSRDSTASAAWSFEQIPAPSATEVFDYRVDGSGAVHAVFRNTQYPCDPCNVDFYHGVLPAGGEQWSTSVVQAGKWGDPNDELVESAALAFDSAGEPFVAAHFARRAITGSYIAAELRIYGVVDGEWCGESVATETDGYGGADGTGFTGADPRFEVDDAGRFHVLFADQSVWHESGMQNEMRGQLRYAVRAGETWHYHTLLEQEGQTASPLPLVGLSAPQLAVSPSGGTVVAAAVAHTWQTDSIYNDEAVPATYTARAVVSDLGI